MFFGVSIGLVSAVMQSSAYIFSRRFGTVFHSPLKLVIYSQLLMGIRKYQGRSMLRDAADVLRQFEGMCKATLCKDLKGRDTGVVLCECDDCVRNAVTIAGTLL